MEKNQPKSQILKSTKGYKTIKSWLSKSKLKPFEFQEEAWQYYLDNRSGIINAPTGFGKTYSVFLATIISWINEHPDTFQKKKKNGLQLLWITPLRALAKDIHRAMVSALAELDIPWKVATRNGDTPTSERAKQKINTPEILIITPESLHLIIASKDNAKIFGPLKCVAVDEWHELIGTKRGVLVELALSYIKALHKNNADPDRRQASLPIWGISATIGNLQEAMVVLLGDGTDGVLVKAALEKRIAIHTLLPETVERFPWAGHLGVKMVNHVLPVIHASRTTLLFTNVRSQAEIWYQALLEADPDLAGVIALHHSAIDSKMRLWVEDQLHAGTLKVVVCTSSLDLGVDFRPVDTVIQVGSPKGVARFLQRAGRAGHSPHAVSNIYFVPTHSLEILEAVALRTGYEQNIVEKRSPAVMSFDVLIQYMITRAVGDGFHSIPLYAEVIQTHCFADLSWDEWESLIAFITTGGNTLHNYDEYHKVDVIEGLYKVRKRMIAMRHRMNMGAIVGEALLRVKFKSGGFIGTIEEYFISRLKPGDAFILAGKRLELIGVKDMDALVKKSTAKNAIVPAWNGGRLPLSANLGAVLRHTWQEAAAHPESDPLFKFLEPLLKTQAALSDTPRENELLMEMIETKDAYHLFVYPFEGRLVHQALAALLAYRISKVVPISFSIAMNDYGFELKSEVPIPVTMENVSDFFSTKDWYVHLQRSVNAAELGRRKFRDIAVIAGLIFQGYPGEHKKQRHLQNSSGLIYDVLMEAEPNHVLLQQSYTEVFTYEIEGERLHEALERISTQRINLQHPKSLTPFSFPIKVDSLRSEISSEQLADRISRLQTQLERL